MLTAVATVERIARTCHEANRALCIAFGDFSQVPWDEAPDWQRKSAIDGVMFRLENPDATPEDMHLSWMNAKALDGWSYGPVKDAEAKTHPSFRPYGELGPEQQAKDHVFGAIVAALSYQPAAASNEAPTIPPIKFGHPIVVNTPGRPLDGITQHAAIVTAVEGETVCSAYVVPAGKPPFHLLGLEREDTIDRTNNPHKASWQFTS